MDIRLDDLSGFEVAKLLSEHLQSMKTHCPAEGIHALDIEALKKPEITFWSAWDGTKLMGCGALKELSEQHAEIKSMRTASSHLRKGVASKLLAYILDQARLRGYQRVSLETGSQDVFEAARQLYANFGFVNCEPFADYIEGQNNVFMTKEL